MEILVDLEGFRNKRNQTQQAAGAKIDIDQRQWSRYENGINQLPIKYLIEICKNFDVSAEELYEMLKLKEKE